MILPEPFAFLSCAVRHESRVPRGGMLFARGDPALGPFLLLEGEVELVRHGEDGHATTLFRACAGEMIAEASLFAESYHCDALACSDSRLVALDGAMIHARLASSPSFARSMVERLALQGVECG